MHVTQKQLDTATELRQRQLVWQHERDQFGIPIPNKRHPFNQFRATALEVGKESSGLGLYFFFQRQLIIFLLVLSLLAIPLMIWNRVTWDRQFDIVAPDQCGEEIRFKCNRPADSLSTLALGSYGQLCVPSENNGIKLCSEQCVIFNKVDCKKLVNAIEDGDELCDKVVAFPVRPERDGEGGDGDGDEGRGEDGDRDGAEDETQYQCQLEFPPQTRSRHAIYAWLMVVFNCVFMTWILYLRQALKRFVRLVDNNVLTAADFAVVVIGLPHGPASAANGEDPALIRYARHYGAVVTSVDLTMHTQLLHMGKKLDAIMLAKRECEQLVADQSYKNSLSNKLHVLLWLGGIANFTTNPQCRLDALEAAEQKVQASLDELSDKPLYKSGRAILIFNYEKHQRNMLSDHKDSWRVLARHLCCCCLGCFGGLHAPRVGQLGVSWPTNAMNKLPEGYPVSGLPVAVHRAPEPNDIIWENQKHNRTEILLRRCAGSLILLGVIGLGAYLQYIVASNAASERIESFSEEQFKLTWKNLAARQHAIYLAIVTTLFNIIAVVVASVTTTFECWATHTDWNRVQVVKLTFFMLVNAFVVPVIVATSFSKVAECDESVKSQTCKCSRGWYAPGAMAEEAVFIQLTAALVPDIYEYLKIKFLQVWRLRHWKKHARTQEMLNKGMAPGKYILSIRCASAVKTLGLAWLYFPIAPVSALIGLAGVAFTTVTDRWIALRLIEKPPSLEYDFVEILLLLISCLPLAQAILNGMVFFEQIDNACNLVYNSPISSSLAVSIVLWSLFFLVPQIARFISKAQFRRRAERQLRNREGTGQSFIDSIGAAPETTQDTLTRYMPDNFHPMQKDGAKAKPTIMYQVYAPCIPKHLAHTKYLAAMGERFGVPNNVRQPFKRRMVFQRPNTGGPENTAIDSSKHRHSVDASKKKQGLEQQSNGNVVLEAAPVPAGGSAAAQVEQAPGKNGKDGKNGVSAATTAGGNEQGGGSWYPDLTPCRPEQGGDPAITLDNVVCEESAGGAGQGGEETDGLSVMAVSDDEQGVQGDEEEAAQVATPYHTLQPALSAYESVLEGLRRTASQGWQ